MKYYFTPIILGGKKTSDMKPNICEDVQYFSGRSGPIILGNPWAVSYEARHMLTINSIIPLLGLYPKEVKHMSTQHLLQNIGNSFILQR